MDERTTRRRRGAELERAIFAAVVEEVAELGYASASLEGIAARAGVGRMSLYRRWPGKLELVLATLRATLPPLPEADPASPPAPPAAPPSLRDELVRLLTAMFAAPSGLPAFAIQLAAAAATPQDPRLAVAVREQILEPRLRRLRDAFTRAAERGELRADADVALLARVGPAVLFQQALVAGAMPGRRDVLALVDGVLLPAASRSGSSGAAGHG